MAQNRTWDFGEKRLTTVLNRHFEDVIPSGVYKGFNVEETSPASLSLDVNRAPDSTNVLITPEGIRIEEDADVPGAVTLSAGDPSNPRIDLIFMKHKYDPSTNNPGTFEVVAGTPAPSPIEPTPPVDTFFRTRLASVLVPTSATSIVTADITNVAKASLGFLPALFNSLSDISTNEANAFNGMAGRGFFAPSAANIVATVADTNAKTFQPTPSNPNDAKVNIKGGRVWNGRVSAFTDVVNTAITLTAVTTNPRIDLISVNPDTGAFTTDAGAELAVPVPAALSLVNNIPIAHVLIDEVSPAAVVVTETDITDVRPAPHVRTPELFDLPSMTTGIKDGITGAAAPAAANVFQTKNDVDTAVAPLGTPFIVSRLKMDTGITSGDQVKVFSGLFATVHNSSFTTFETIRTTSDLIADGGAAEGPGGIETSLTIAVATWYHIYLIASSTGAVSPALVISLSITQPDLTAAAFTGYDLFRRLGGARTEDAATDFIVAFNRGGETRYRNQHLFYDITIDPIITADFQNVNNVLSVVARVPPTSDRGIIHAMVNLFAAGTNRIIFFIDGGDTTQTTSGGIEIARVSTNTGSGFSDHDSSEVVQQLDNIQRLKVRFEGAFPAGMQLHTVGYIEDL